MTVFFAHGCGTSSLGSPLARTCDLLDRDDHVFFGMVAVLFVLVAISNRMLARGRS